MAAAIAILLVGLAAGPASAHPLGNFTVNRYARIEVSGDVVRVYYVLDEAEIPAFQERRALEAGEARFLRERVAEIGRSLRLTVDGEAVTLEAVESALDQPEGQGGLRTLRVAAIFEATVPDAAEGTSHRLSFTDGNEPGRVGWREIVAVARGSGSITRSDVPDRDVSDELRDYPGDLLQAPLDRREATISYVAAGSNAAADPLPESSPAPERAGGVFASLVTRQGVTPVVLLGMLGVALAVGAGHALLPGHGKTVMAAYLVGTKGRAVDAVLLGVIVSLMHTASVLVLGLLLFRVGRATSLESYYPALTVASGILAAALGVWLLVGRWRRFQLWRDLHDHDHHDDELDAPAPVHVHPGDAHDHGGHGHGHHHPDRDEHEGSHGAPGQAATAVAASTTSHLLRRRVPSPGHHHHGPGGHTHELPEDVAPLSRRGLILLATSGGVVPSPTAVVVIVSAFSLGRPALGLGLIGAFSVGLAATLTAVGLTLVFGRQVVERRFSARTLELLPTIGAIALIVLGLVLALRGLTGTV